MPIPQAAHYMNCPLHELPITGFLLYLLRHYAKQAFKQGLSENGMFFQKYYNQYVKDLWIFAKFPWQPKMHTCDSP